MTEDFLICSALIAEELACQAHIHIFRSYYESKPIMHQTRSDLLYCELCSIYGLAMTTGKAIVIAYHIGIVAFMPWWAVLAWAWAIQFMLQVMMLYFVYPTFYRYLIVYNHITMILVDYDDSLILAVIRIVSAIFSGGLCWALILAEKRPMMYHVYYLGNTDPSDFAEAHFVVTVVAVAATVANVILRICISRESSSSSATDDADETTLALSDLEKALTGVIIFCLIATAFWLTFYLGHKSSDIAGFSKSMVVLQLNSSVLAPLALLYWNSDIKKFAKTYLKGLFSLAEFRGLKKNNSVSPEYSTNVT